MTRTTGGTAKRRNTVPRLSRLKALPRHIVLLVGFSTPTAGGQPITFAVEASVRKVSWERL